jgi:hypothetical protein
VGRLFQDSGSTADERRTEADRLLTMLEGYEVQMEPKELRFIEDVNDGRAVTPKMLFWLRDIKDKYL